MNLWQSITGYFTFPDYYDWIAKQTHEGPLAWRGVEVGVYTGQSAAFLCERLYKHARLDLVDSHLNAHNALQNLAPVMHMIGSAHQCDSVEASTRYDNSSLDFVFIDADHSYEAVRRDIAAWLPKVKAGGIIAGHDYCHWPGFGVIEAVTEAFERVEVWRGSKGMGDAQMMPRWWPVWSVRV